MSQQQKRRSFRILLTLSILGGLFGIPMLVGSYAQENAGNDDTKKRVQIRFLEQAGQSNPQENSNPSGLPTNKVDRGTVGTNPVAANQVPVNVATEEERNQVIASDWENPWAVLFVTGRQYGYIEPCGCTGLENQKGGLMRRDSLLSKIKERGWKVVPLDAGNQVRRVGKQSEFKYDWTAKALSMMGYAATTYGPDDLKGSFDSLLYPLINTPEDANGKRDSLFVSANVSVYPDLDTTFKVVEVGNRRIGITAVLGDEYTKSLAPFLGQDVKVLPAKESLMAVTKELQAQKCDLYVLIAHASLEESRELAKEFPMYPIIVTAGGYGEPTYRPEIIEGTKTQMIQVGTKGMYAGIIGLFDDASEPMRYQRLALSSQFEDSPRINELFSMYQDQLKAEGLKNLAPQQPHISGREFVGSEKCGECHTTAFEIWKSTPHSHATESIVEPPERPIPRHFDPECLSCHVTGWNPQAFQPFKTGFASLEASGHLVGSGCENCHGPGKAHVDAESGDVKATQEMLKALRREMQLPLEKAQDKCLECHDIDNSPDFHKEGAFKEYWEKVKHYGKD